MRIARVLLMLAFLAAALLGAGAARAHGTRSVSVDVTEVSPGRAVVHVRASLPEDEARARPTFQAPCSATSGEEEGEAVSVVTCPGSLAGSRITVEGLGPILSEAILVVSLHDGARISRVLTAGEPSFALPAAQGRLTVAAGYTRLGVVHILTGYDHLLFLLSLVLLLRRPRAVLLAETAFTVSHSLSFSATALGLIHVSAPAAEAAIALSLVLVALDVGKPVPAGGADPGRANVRGLRPPTPPETRRAPGTKASPARAGAAMAFVFGLVHGLGFAGGLAEIGVPEAHVSLALAGFAAGVEAGQVAFLMLALLAFHLAARAAGPRLPTLVRWGSVAVGGVAFSWLIERTLVVFSSRV